MSGMRKKVSVEKSHRKEREDAKMNGKKLVQK
jgi:hypothetical protein